MKFTYLALLKLFESRKVTMQDVQRNIGGSYLESLEGFERGYNYGGQKSLNGLAMMTVFLDNSRVIEQRTSSIEGLELTIEDFLDRFTNYGCYCWILGPLRGVIGGGQTKDAIDSLCGELYKCYKCLNIDFGAKDTMFQYNVNLIENNDGQRELECVDGDNKDACLCDVMFAEKMSVVNSQCEADLANGVTDSMFCVNDEFRTSNGGGNFDPFDNSADGCLKVNMDNHNAKDACCGEYPDRLPFDSGNRECCQMSHNDGVSSFTQDKIVPAFTCEDRGGSLVEVLLED